MKNLIGSTVSWDEISIRTIVLINTHTSHKIEIWEVICHKINQRYSNAIKIDISFATIIAGRTIWTINKRLCIDVSILILFCNDVMRVRLNAMAITPKRTLINWPIYNYQHTHVKSILKRGYYELGSVKRPKFVSTYRDQ